MDNINASLLVLVLSELLHTTGSAPSNSREQRVLSSLLTTDSSNRLKSIMKFKSHKDLIRMGFYFEKKLKQVVGGV